jgi:type IV pilus assembly protein PilV
MTIFSQQQPMKSQTGFTLVEVLIAVVILAVGLLGLAGLQTTGLSNNQSAYNRSQATQLAYDIADRMRSNPTAAASYVVGSPSTCPTGDNPCTACTTAANSCTPAQLAQRDLFDWNAARLANFPNEGVSQVTGPVGGVYTVTISWDDDKSANANLQFLMRFRL